MQSFRVANVRLAGVRAHFRIGVCRYQYANIFSLVRELGLRDVFTRFTPSGFWSPSGLTTQVLVPQLSTSSDHSRCLGLP